MAHILKRGTKWAYIVNIARDSTTWKRRQITKSGFKTKKEAQLAAYKLEEAITNGGIIKETNITFGNFAEKWIEYYGTQVKVSSVRARSIAMKHLISRWGHLPLRKITRHMYQS